MNRITVYQDPKNEVLLKGLDLLMSNSESSAAELLSLVEAEEEKEKAIGFNQLYHRYNDLVREGEYYRIASYRENGMYDCWQVVSQDRTESLVTYVQVRFETDQNSRRLKLDGLDPKTRYRLEGTQEVYSGEMLMNAGFLQEMIFGDYGSRLLHFVAENR